MEENVKKQPEFFCSYSSRLTNTGAPFCVFKRTPKLLAIVSYWSNGGRNQFADFDEDGNPTENKVGDP